MCRTYHWTCNICGRSQTRGQRCSNALAGTVNCPNNTRADGPPPQAEHNALRCAYCYTPTLKTESHFVNPASFATNARWEPRHAVMSPSRDTNGQHQTAPADYQSLSGGLAAAMRGGHPAMATTPNPSIHHRQYSNSGHAQPVLPHGQHPHHRLPAAPGALGLPILAHQHHHGRFASPTPPSLPVDPLLAHPLGRPHHHAVCADSHAAAPTPPPPFQPHAPPPTPAEHHRSPEQALPLHPHASPTAAAAAPATGGGAGGGGEGPATGAAHLRPTADMLASMTATRTALFAQAEARRAAAIEKAQREGEQKAAKQGSDVAGDAQVEAAWYAMWAGCGVSPAAVSAAQTAAAVERRGRERRKEDRTSDGHRETSGTGQE